MDKISQNFFKTAADRYEEKTVIDDKSGRITFAQPTKILTNSEYRKRNLMMEKIEELVRFIFSLILFQIF